MARTEVVPGAFFEYTWTAGERLVTVAGLRADFHNLYGTFASLDSTSDIVLPRKPKVRFGRGFRTANVFMEQLGLGQVIEGGLSRMDYNRR